jgi:hypothetical protein
MRLLLLALLVAVGVGCGDHGSRGAPGVIRLIDDPGIDRTKPFLSWGSRVVVADVERPVLSSSTPFTPASEVLTNAKGGHSIRATIPPETRGLPWVVFETVTTRKGIVTV